QPQYGSVGRNRRPAVVRSEAVCEKRGQTWLPVKGEKRGQTWLPVKGGGAPKASRSGRGWSRSPSGRRVGVRPGCLSSGVALQKRHALRDALCALRRRL